MGVRQSRAAESRTQSQRPAFAQDYRGKHWIDPARIPTGIRLQWVRSHILNMPDNANVSRRLAEGWNAVDPAAYPDLVPKTLPGMDTDPTVIRNEGLILMQRPEEWCAADDADFREMNEQVIASVDRDRQGDGVNFKSEREVTSRIDRNKARFTDD